MPAVRWFVQVYDTENANLKEKFESDLKKEIKKLQRYRDQIKTWIQSSEVKDKKPLLDARRNIEKEMERFKVCEKETKTKAFSKEGLGQLPKTDPREKAKGEAREWVNTAVSDLEGQVDSFEAEMENLVVKKGKARPPRLMHLDTSVARHKAHIAKLEMILRLLENDELAPDEVNDVRDLIQDYLDRNQDDPAEFEDPDALYDQLPAEKMEALETLDAAPPGLPPPVAPSTQAALMKPPLPPPPQAAAVSAHTHPPPSCAAPNPAFPPHRLRWLKRLTQRPRRRQRQRPLRWRSASSWWMGLPPHPCHP